MYLNTYECTRTHISETKISRSFNSDPIITSTAKKGCPQPTSRWPCPPDPTPRSPRHLAPPGRHGTPSKHAIPIAGVFRGSAPLINYWKKTEKFILKSHALDKHEYGTWVAIGCVLVAWHSGYNVSLWAANLIVPRSTCSWRVTTYVGKPSTTGQPTRPTQPFIL